MKTIYSTLLCLLGILPTQYTEAHSHTTYIVERAPTTVVVAQPPNAVVEVQSTPPAYVEEVPSACPGEGYAWIKGHWQWDGAQWIIVHGHWAHRPHERAVWVAGEWHEHHHGHWGWHEGYWR
jgi:hypothetical protein